eukprot:3124513-Prymnesium_polylepis.1
MDEDRDLTRKQRLLGTASAKVHASADAHAAAELNERANARARLDVAFVRELGTVLGLATSGASPLCIVAELFLCGSLALTVLCALNVKHAPPISGAALAGLNAAGLGACVLAHAALRSRATCNIPRTLVDQHSIVFLFACVQAYNVAGFFASLVPSLIYQVLTATATGEGGGGGEGGSGSDEGGNGSGDDAGSTCDAQFFDVLLRSIGYLAVTVATKALMTAAQQSVGLLWRQALTVRLQTRLRTSV